MRLKKTLAVSALALAAVIAIPGNAAFSASTKANKPVLHVSYNDHAKASRASVAFITKLPAGCAVTVGYVANALFPSPVTATLTGTAKQRTARATLVTPTAKGDYVVNAVLANTDACGKYRGITISKKIHIPGQATPGKHVIRPTQTPEPTSSPS